METLTVEQKIEILKSHRAEIHKLMTSWNPKDFTKKEFQGVLVDFNQAYDIYSGLNRVINAVELKLAA